MTKQEQDIAFSRLESRIGPDMALYCMCAVFDVAYDSERDAETWTEYVKSSDEKLFEDGITDINAVLLAGMSETERWLTVWGDEYSEADYKQLDKHYKTMTDQLDATGGIDRQQEDTARVCALMALQRNKLLRKTDKDSIATAKNLDVMIRENLKDSNMRKADILPSAQQRPDGFVDALKKKYGLSMEMSKEDVMQAFFNWCRSKHYPETVDAEEHAMMAILRTMQKNDDLPEPTDLPPEFDFGPYEAQFEKDPNEAELQVYDYLGLVRGEFAGEDD